MPDYNTKDLPYSKNFYIDIRPNGEVGRDTYIACNKDTNVGEAPFMLLSDAVDVLKDLEEYRNPNPKKTNLSQVH